MLVCKCVTLILHRVEQAYIDAYEGEGWKGANREKLKSDGDLKQAQLQVNPRLSTFQSRNFPRNSESEPLTDNVLHNMECVVMLLACQGYMACLT